MSVTYTEYFTNSTIRGPGQWYTRINRAAQAPPIDRTVVLPYRRLELHVQHASLSGKIRFPLKNGFPIYADVNYISQEICVSAATCGSAESNYGRDLAVNKARSKFMSCMHERAEWMVNLTERKEALAMVGKRSAQFGRFLSATANFALNPRATIKRLYKDLRGITSSAMRKRIRSAINKWRSGAKSLASLWLELHLGWEPMVKDIYASYEILSQEPAISSIRKGSGRIPISYKTVSPFTGTDGYFERKMTGTAEAWVFGDVKVTDPNLYRTQRLGLTNPASWLWQVLPWSFVSDWFANLGNWLAQWDETLGVEIVNPGYSIRVRNTIDGSWVEPKGSCKCRSHSTLFERFKGIPAVTLRSYLFNGFSPIRGVTAIALLVQLFGRNPKSVLPDNKYYRLFDWNSMTSKFYRHEAI